jgi:hypothetical protein
MARIQDKTRYPIDTNVTKEDYLVGSDADSGFKTMNFNIGSIIRLFNSELNHVSTEFKFSDGTDPDISESDQGFFLTNGGETAPADINKIFINKLNMGGQDLSDKFSLLVNNVYTFSLKMINAGDPSDVFFFKINSAIDQGDHFELSVNPIGMNYVRTFNNFTTFNLFMEVVSTQDNKNLIKNVGVAGELTEDKVATAINGLTQFVVSEEQNVFYQATSYDGPSATYIPKSLGKGVYGNGGTVLTGADLQVISSGASNPPQEVITKSVTFSGAHSDSKVVAAFNILPSFELSSNGSLYIKATSENPETYVYAVKDIAPGEFGSGKTPIVEANLELISIYGGGVANLVKDVTITGDPTESNVATAINALGSFYVAPNQSVYYRATISGTSTQYTFVTEGIGSGTYGSGGTALTASDLKLISVNSGGTSWNLKVEGIQKKAVKGGESIDFKGKKYAVVAYTADGVLEISTSQALDDLLDKLKPVIPISEADHQALVDAGNEEDALYLIPCS